MVVDVVVVAINDTAGGVVCGGLLLVGNDA